MRIIPLTPENASAASRIYALSWKSGYRGLVPQDYLDALTGESWTSALLTPGRSGFLLEDCGVCVATASVSAARDAECSGWGEIISLYVLPAYWGRGYGKSLLAHAAAYLRAQGFRNLYLWVLEGNVRARAFYERSGFAPDGGRMTLHIGGRALIGVRYVCTAPPPRAGQDAVAPGYQLC